MKYIIELKPKAEKDFKELQEKERIKFVKILREEKAASASEPTRKLDDILAEIG
ncbi:MAG: hypothetical protein IZT59_13765 [Verrucomicrobia bacterium]|nr:hypothetical protein [Verrucomicrobiota bacterium]